MVPIKVIYLIDGGTYEKSVVQGRVYPVRVITSLFIISISGLYPWKPNTNNLAATDLTYEQSHNYTLNLKSVLKHRNL